ncbi:MAG: divalent cation tolerance protein CutA [Mycobacterium sp.]|nr:divalent cation tolerance protein CutA [Mycobacterium sp.]
MVEAIIKRANEPDPYDVPQVVTVSAVAAHPDYQAWVLAETTAPELR